MDEVKQNREPRDLKSRATTYRPTSWKAPEVLPMPDERPGWKHRYKIGRAHV